jgi:chemotaxis-related protein WspB
MLMLLFYAGQERYAIDCEYVIEVVPRLDLKEIQKAPPFAAGLMNYAGNPVPVIDMTLLLAQKPSAHALHSRIILTKSVQSAEKSHTLGLLAEKVTEAIDLEISKFKDPGLRIKDFPYLDGIYTEQGNSIRLIDMNILYQTLREIFLT